MNVLKGFEKPWAKRVSAFVKSTLKCGSFKLGDAYQCASEVVKLPSPPTAVFSLNYEMTLGLMRGLTESGVECPAQVSVLGFDDFVVGIDGFSWATVFSPKLTTVAQFSYELGRKAMQLLLKKIERAGNETEESEGETVRLPAELRIRESTASPAST
ncbi:MAG: substrate-binding domain-containing protein [Terriglobia bacterium]